MPEDQNDTDNLWATTTIVDQAAIDHERDFGPIQGSGETVRVRIAQRVEFDLLSDPVGVKVHPARLHVGDSEFTIPQGHEAYKALGAAMAFADRIESSPPADQHTKSQPPPPGS